MDSTTESNFLLLLLQQFLIILITLHDHLNSITHNSNFQTVTRYSPPANPTIPPHITHNSTGWYPFLDYSFGRTHNGTTYTLPSRHVANLFHNVPGRDPHRHKAFRKVSAHTSSDVPVGSSQCSAALLHTRHIDSMHSLVAHLLHDVGSDHHSSHSAALLRSPSGANTQVYQTSLTS